jgi:hypothetical protein
MIAVCFNILGYENHMIIGKHYPVIVITATQGYYNGKETYILKDERGKMISFNGDNFWGFFMREEDWRNKQIDKLIF